MSSAKDTLKIALVQLQSTNNVEQNSLKNLELLNSITEKVDLVSLPENAFYIRIQETDKVDYIPLESDFWKPYQEFCVSRGCYLHIGATPLEYQGHQWNSTVWITPEGEVSAPYQKVHLFDIFLENKKPILESEIFKHGESPSIVDVFGWKVGLTICYDIRFSELFFYYQTQHVDMILTPAAFLVETGKMHWEILQRARAIESQCYIVAAAQGGHHGESRHTYGHSMIVSPWGHKLAEIQDVSRASYTICEVLKADVLNMRKQIPMKQHRRIKVSF